MLLPEPLNTPLSHVHTRIVQLSEPINTNKRLIRFRVSKRNRESVHSEAMQLRLSL